MSKIFVNEIRGKTAAGTVKMPAGHILQTVAGNSDNRFMSGSTSWVDTGMFALTFPNNLQSGSKVLVRIHATIGEANNNNWSNRLSLSIFENTTNKGSDDYGMVNGNAQHHGDAWTVYEVNRLTGEEMFTPSVLNGTYKLYFKSQSGFARVVGQSENTGAHNPTGKTQVILQEIAQ